MQDENLLLKVRQYNISLQKRGYLCATVMVAIDGFLAVAVIRLKNYYAGSCAGNAVCAFMLGAIGNCLPE